MPSAIRIPSLRLTELDGSPDVQGVEHIYLTSGFLTNMGGGNALLSLSGSSSGGGITAVSSLGSAGGAINPKFLTTDNHLYINDGTLWHPTDAPGWPRRDGADDEEWESNDANPPTGWTWDNQDSTADNENGTRKSHLVLDKSVNGSGQSVIYKAVPASSNKTYYAALQWGSDLAGSGNNCQVGIAARSSGGKLLICTVAGNPTPTLFVARWDTSTSFNTISFTASIVPHIVPGQTFVLAFTSDGTNLSFKYSPHYGGGEETLKTVYSEAIATHLGTFNQFGLSIFKNSGTTNSLYCDWLRVL